MSLSALLQVLAMRLVGTLVDRIGRRRLLLGVLAYTGAVGTMLLYVVRGDQYLLGGLLFLVTTVAYTCSIVVYNAWLPDIAATEERDRVSSRGWALGYLGGGLLLTANLALLQQAQASRLGIDLASAVRISIVWAGGWWALFTLVPLAGLRDAPPRPVAAGGSLHQLAATLRRMRHAPATLTFLAVYLLYNDGVQTVILQSAVYAAFELDLSEDIIVIAVLIVQVVAVGGALLLGRLAGRFGAKRVVLASLLVWIGVLGFAYVLPPGEVPVFLALAACIGLVLGGRQALSRSLFSHMVPDGAEAGNAAPARV